MTPSRNATSDVERAIIEIVAARKKIAPAQISPDATFAVLGIDSLETVDLIFELEERFDITISDEDVRRITTVGEAAAALREGLGHRARAY